MTGMSISDARFIERINLAQEELMNEGQWPGVVDRWHILFDEISGELTLPYYLDQLLQVTVDRVPLQIMSPWAEFVNYGTGPRDDDLLNGVSNGNCRTWFGTGDCLDRGEVVSHYPIPVADGPWKLRCYASVAEADGAVINLQGFYQDKVIRTLGTSWYNGENLAINFSDPYTESVSNFDRLTAVVKPETNGYVRITAWNGTTEIDLSDYAPVETNPSYRRYFIQRLWRAQTGIRNRVVLARARKRYVPVEEDDDELIISNMNALKCMMIAQWKRDAADYQAYEEMKAQAVDILKKEAVAYNGRARTPAISMTRGASLGFVPPVR